MNTIRPSLVPVAATLVPTTVEYGEWGGSFVVVTD